MKEEDTMKAAEPEHDVLTAGRHMSQDLKRNKVTNCRQSASPEATKGNDQDHAWKLQKDVSQGRAM